MTVISYCSWDLRSDLDVKFASWADTETWIVASCVTSCDEPTTFYHVYDSEAEARAAYRREIDEYREQYRRVWRLSDCPDMEVELFRGRGYHRTESVAFIRLPELPPEPVEMTAKIIRQGGSLCIVVTREAALMGLGEGDAVRVRLVRPWKDWRD